MTEKQKAIVEFLESETNYHEKFVKEYAQEVENLIKKEEWISLLDILPDFTQAIMEYSTFDGTLGNYMEDNIN